MKILIVLNQTDSDIPVARHDYIIGVDGGCRWCMENNQPIDLAIGDFDSLSKADLHSLSGQAVNIERHPENKDYTDLELALASALKKKPTSITVYGVWGGRIDHSLANLLCIASQSGQSPVIMQDKDHSAYLLKNRQKIIMTATVGHTVSIMALGSDCAGVSNMGFKYSLSDAIIQQGTGIGLSNLTTEPVAEVSLDSGILLILAGSQCTASITRQNKEQWHECT